MTPEKWLIAPGQTRVIEIDDISHLKVSLVGGQIDIVAHDESGIRIDVHTVTGRDLRIEAADGRLEIDHPQLRWDNFLDVFKNFTASGPKAEISVAVPRAIALNLGVVSASALIADLRADVRVSTVSGDVIVDGLTGALTANTVSGDLQARSVNGPIDAHTVSGNVAAAGELTKVAIDTVSGRMLVDAAGPVHNINLNSISGDATVRLDPDYPANYQVRSVSGTVQIDGVVHAKNTAVSSTSVNQTAGELSGSFVDLRANSVSGDVIVVRRTMAEEPA